MQLLEKLGVDVSPGDVVGLSTQIMYGSGQAEAKRQQDLANRCGRQCLQIVFNFYILK